MKRYFHGEGKTGPYFEGWYFKCQTTEGRAIALIPAFHIDGRNRRSASLQIIADSGVWWLEYPPERFAAAPAGFCIQTGENTFSKSGLRLQIDQPGLSLRGTLRFGPLLPLRSDIMGPFRFLSNMECAHGVISMAHELQGQLALNGEFYDFSGGTGYIETDRGRAFPSAYLWTQCSWPQGSLMLSIATIPLAGICFTGCICALVNEGKEYRLATYRGVTVTHWSETGAVVRQGKYRLEVDLLEAQPQPLRAPVDGRMDRTIHESLCAKLRCRFWIGDTLVLDHTDRSAGFEYAKLPS